MSNSLRQQSFPARQRRKNCSRVPSPAKPGRCRRKFRGTVAPSHRETSMQDTVCVRIPRSASRSSHSTMSCMSDLSHEILDKILYVTSVRCQIAQHTNEAAQSRPLRFIKKIHLHHVVWHISPQALPHISLQHGHSRTSELLAWLVLDHKTTCNRVCIHSSESKI